jgi:hypothetical protein
MKYTIITINFWNMDLDAVLVSWKFKFLVLKYNITDSTCTRIGSTFTNVAYYQYTWIAHTSFTSYSLSWYLQNAVIRKHLNPGFSENYNAYQG